MADQYTPPEEEGIREEGFFDFGADVLDRISKKIKGDEENPSLLRKALSTLPALAAVPLMPSKSTAKKAGEGLKDVVKAFSFRKIQPNEIKKVSSYGQSATKKALEGVPDEVRAIKHAAQKEALGVKDIPKNAPKSAEGKWLSQEEINDILKSIGD